jgi:Peptidase inhibitor family I36
MRIPRVAQAAAALLVVVLATAMAPAPAQGRSLSQCAGTTLTCLWNGKNFSGSPAATFPMDGPFGSCYNVSPLNGANNNAESVLNENPFQVSFYDSPGGTGYMFSLAAGSGESDLSVHPSPGGFQNRISSVCRE